MADLVMDFARRERCGVEEAVLCEFKSAAQIAALLEMARVRDARLLFTRLTPAHFATLDAETRNYLHYYPCGNIAVYGNLVLGNDKPQVAIVSAGASDARVCEEAEITLRYHGVSCRRFEDVGVSALWRLEQRLAEIAQAEIVIAVAGMEAALPTVLSGMTAQPIIAVPTSVGYGVSAGGELALHACLGSCAAGLLTVNIDNGFGAACAAIKLLRQFCR